MNQSALDCEGFEDFIQFPASCPPHSWAVEIRRCNPVSYTGSVCKEALLEWQNCLYRQARSATIVISLSQSQAELEEQAMQILEVLSE